MSRKPTIEQMKSLDGKDLLITLLLFFHKE